ncbi:aldehyde dehydrogenase family protein [Bdellovibrionota bacterium FG-2]
MTHSWNKLYYRGSFVRNVFDISSDISGEWIAGSPVDPADEIAKITYSYRQIDAAVLSAREAFRLWKKSLSTERKNLLVRLSAALEARRELIVQSISRETGKPLWEAETEFESMLGKVSFALEDVDRTPKEIVLAASGGEVSGVSRYRALGVLAVITPFNFPGSVALGHIIPAIASGNTVVLKPSEKTPFVGQAIAECFEEAGFPSGVFNLVQGEREVGRRLCAHPDVSGVLFSGSFEVGTRIKQETLQQHWKLLVLQMGGKNSAIIWEDADLEYAVQEVLVGAFITAGQRCTATSRVIVHKKLLDQFMARFHERAKSFTIGHPLNQPFMGPMIDQGAVDRYMKFIGIATREKCDVIMRGKSIEVEGVKASGSNYVTPSICLVEECSVAAALKSVYQQTEIFGPNAAVLVTEDLDHALALANATQYGLVSSVFTKDRAIFEKCASELETGLINWNRSTVGGSSKLPFGGLKKSGNHYATALFSAMYCMVPVTSIEIPEPPAVLKKYPGLN